MDKKPKRKPRAVGGVSDILDVNEDLNIKDLNIRVPRNKKGKEKPYDKCEVRKTEPKSKTEEIKLQPDNSSEEKRINKSEYDTANVSIPELDEIFKTLASNDPFVQFSKDFICLVPSVEGLKLTRYYKCSLCNVRITDTEDFFKLRFSIWQHINEPLHKRNLPNYDSVVSDVNNILNDFCQNIPDEFKDEVRRFDLGPVNGFLNCTSCASAVFCNLNGVKNHLANKHHLIRKEILTTCSPKVSERKIQDMEENGFKNLMLQIPANLQSEFKKYIIKGQCAGYVICSLCSRAISCTPFFIEQHVNDVFHKNNKRKSTKMNTRNKANTKTQRENKIMLNDTRKEIGSDLDCIICVLCLKSVSSTSYSITNHFTYSCDENNHISCKGIKKPSEKNAKSKEKCNSPINNNECKQKDFHEVFNSLDKSDHSLILSQKYIQMDKDTPNLRCYLCNTTITASENMSELRFNIWDHISDVSHKNKLPDYNIANEYDTFVNNFRGSVPLEYRDDLNYLSLGPVHKYCMCTLCHCAVFLTRSSLLSHFRSEQHVEKTNCWETLPEISDQKVEDYASINERNYKRLLAKLPEALKPYEKFIKQGRIWGYVVCSLCSQAVNSSLADVVYHLTNISHSENKSSVLSFLHKDGLSIFTMGLVLNLIQTNAEDIESLKCLYGNLEDKYYCKLCDAEIQKEDTMSKISQTIGTHLKLKKHQSNMTRLHTSVIKSRLNKVRDAEFSLLGTVPVILFESSKCLDVSVGMEYIRCLPCKKDLSPDQTIIVDHVQSEDHRREIIKCKLTSNVNSPSAVEVIFENIMKNNINVDCSHSFPFFHVNEDGSKVVCSLCSCDLSDSTVSMSSLETMFISHESTKSHTQRLVDYLIRSTEEKGEMLLDIFFNLMPHLSDIDKSSFGISKQDSCIKCKVCKTRLAMKIVTLKRHIEEQEHQDNMKRKKDKSCGRT